MTALAATPTSMDTATNGALPTTAGAIAIGNLQAQIDGHVGEAAVGRLTVQGQAGLIELITLRGHLLGRIVDYARAETMAEQLAQDAPSDGHALLARARVRATFHRFTDALVDLGQAESLGADHERVAAERAAIFQATGRYDEALSIYGAAVDRRADFNSLGDLATLQAERGDIATAENCFHESRARYRGVSPIPLAQLDFKRAQMWMTQGDLLRARPWLEDAMRRLPAYAPAAGHLAEVEAALGHTDAAIGRLRPLTISSDDPDYAAQLARILGEVGRLEDAAEWRALAAARYDELVRRHLEAFADHAAEFWLEAGADPARALWFAEKNLEVRPTRRARELVARAAEEDTAHIDSRTRSGLGRNTTGGRAMSESTEKANEAIDYAKLSNAGTSELVEELGKIRAAKKETTERINAEYEFPDSYNPKMGVKVGHVTELRIFFHVKPGHAEALKEELQKFKTDEERNSKLAYVATGIQDMSCTLFDNDTRYLHATTFDTDWDPYIDDSVPTPKQCLKYAKWLQHLEEAGDFGPDNLPTANDIKVLFNQQRETATVYLRSFGDTVVEQYRMKDLQEAFETVLDHPDAAEALSHPALAPLLELAAD